jgi:nucleoside-diphosphate-sugar epimerase
MNANQEKHILITGGAGYFGSYLTGELLRHGYRVTVVDDLLFGGESLLAYLPHPNFYFCKANICEPRTVISAIRKDWPAPMAVIHLAAIAGFPACQAVGQQVAWRYNVEATQRAYEQGLQLGAERFLYASTYTVYGFSSAGSPVSEESPLNPQSLYAETKAASESFLMEQADSSLTPLIFRAAALYGLSPRTRFDMIVNQFILDAFTKRELLIYQRAYSRAFIHIHDAVQGLILGLEAPREKIVRQVFNLGSDDENLTKNKVVAAILKRIPETTVQYKDMTFGGDMRDITVSFAKIRTHLDFQTTLNLDDGVREVLNALRSGLIRDPYSPRYRNAQFIVQ